MLNANFNPPSATKAGICATHFGNESFDVGVLSLKEVADFIALQNKVYFSLPEGKKHHIKVREAGDIISHIQAGMPIITVRDQQGTLVAQALLSYANSSKGLKNLEGYPIGEDRDGTAIIQSVAVDPDKRGQKLAHLLLDYAKEIAWQQGKQKIIAKVADDNQASGKTFLKNAFVKASKGTDPEKFYAVTFWEYCLPVLAFSHAYGFTVA